MANRNLFTSVSAAPVAGAAYMDNVAEKIGLLFNASALKAATVSHTGNQYTITINPTLSGDVTENMAFYVKPDATNTGAVDLRVTSANPYYDVVSVSGAQLAAGEWSTSAYYYVVFLDGAFRVLSSFTANQVTSVAVFEQFDNSGTWNKPAGLADTAIVIVEAWGAGGGGARAANSTLGAGAGGGAYNRKEFRAGDLTSSVAVTIGSGGAGATINNTAGITGGTTSFGGYMTAYGGGGGGVGVGGGGGGVTSAGLVTGIGGGPVFIPSALPFSYGGNCDNSGANLAAGSMYGGAAGGGSAGGPGGSSVYGGGGGASNLGAAGASVFGGNGGAFGVAGSAPGGGGGGTAGGGKGRVIVRIIP